MMVVTVVGGGRWIKKTETREVEKKKKAEEERDRDEVK